MTHERAGERLRVWREAQAPELTQAGLAARLGVSQSTVSNLERGALLPVRTMAIAIEDLTGISVRDWDAHPITDASDASCTQPGTGEQVGT